MNTACPATEIRLRVNLRACATRQLMIVDALRRLPLNDFTRHPFIACRLCRDLAPMTARAEPITDPERVLIRELCGG